MACQEFTVLYTHQKTKKSKVWQDGILKATFGGNKATLYDDQGQVLDSVFMKCQIKPGDDFESERYLITVESENVYETAYKVHPQNKEVTSLTRNPSKLHASSAICRVKRKYSDFQVPRQLEKKKIVEESSAALTSISEGPQLFFPHQFYVPSPLFSVPCKKNDDTILLPNFSGEASTKNTKAIEPMSLLSSNSFDDEHEVIQNKKLRTGKVTDEYLKSEFQLGNGEDISNYPANKGEAVSQNIRSKAQIVALLNNNIKEYRTPNNECTTSLKNQEFIVNPESNPESESNPEVLSLFSSSINTDSLLKNRIVPLSGLTNNANRETNRHICAQHTSEETEQAKSRWDVYMPSYLPAIHNAEHHEETSESLQQSQQGLKEKVKRRQINEDQKGIPQMLSSVKKNFIKSQLCGFLSAESMMSESKSSEFDNTNLNCINSLKTFEDKFSDSNRHEMIESLEEIYPPTSADPGRSEKQVTEVNFNLLEILDFSDTEDNEPNANSMTLQGSISLKEETQPQLVDAQKNRDIKFFSIDSPPLKFWNEFSPKPIKNMENGGKWKHSKDPVIREEVDKDAIHVQNVDIHERFCADRSFLIENNIDYEWHDIKQMFTEVSCPEDAQKSFLHSKSPTLPLISRNHPDNNFSNNTTKTFKTDFNFSEEKLNDKFLTKSIHFKPPDQIVTNSSSNLDLDFTNCASLNFSKDSSELYFPIADVVASANVPKRQMHIPTEFQSPAHYRKVFTSALIEHLNILLFELSQNLHKALGKVDISLYTSATGMQQENSAPLCSHKITTKLVMVRKEGRNKGRLFYVCDAPKSDRCNYFKWFEDVKHKQIDNKPYLKLHDMKSIGTYLRCKRISFYEECQLLIRKAFDIQRKQFGKLKKYNITKASFDCDSKRKLFLKLNWKEHSSSYSKDDIWVISKTLSFEPLNTFIACSVFFGPSSNSEVELEPLNGYSPSNWCSNMTVHALLVCNASTELTNLKNIEENVSSVTLPIMQHLLTKTFNEISPRSKFKKQTFKPPSLNSNAITSETFSPEMIINIASKMTQTFHLNKDQASAMIQIGAMVTMQEIKTETEKHQACPITIIHGVFGSGKSYLLAIIILFLIQIFEIYEAADAKRTVPWKVLISSSTNVAVDRILLSLLDIGFKDFIRIGSIKRIAKPILPYSLHAGSGPESEQLRELLALMKEDLSPVEKIYVKKTIEHHKLGINKASLQKVRVVGSTCAACPFPCIKNLKFPIVILDECSQMTEPSSLLPIARFECEKLILVGDPKQLPPAIQGSESAHGSGLEQTLFDRLCLMGHKPILLRTQYRCHPAIAAITNELFYEGVILNGVSETHRSSLIEWLPTLCFYNVNGSEQMERDNSFYNVAESFFIVKLIQSLIASGIDGSAIGVITLYKSQMSKIRNLLGAIHLDTSQIKAVQVSTVDAFQGAEKEIIVLSCVRTRQVGFIDSEKRVNVALTRGKRHLLIIGNLNCLRKNKLWGSIIQHCAGRKNGLQHVSQCEQQLNDIIKSFTRNANEEINMKTENM